MAEAPQILINDAIRRQVLLEGVKVTVYDEFAKYLKRLENDIRNRLSEEGQTIRNRSRLNKLLVDVRSIEKIIFDEWDAELTGDLDDIAIVAADLEIESLSESTVEEFDPVRPSNEQILAGFAQNALSLRGKGQGLTLEPFLRQYTTDQKALIEGIISQGFTEGQTTGQIIQDLRGTRANNFEDGVYANVNRNTQTMVRTAVQNASSAARQRVWDSNSDVIVGVEIVATLDSRTSVICRSLDGEIFPVDSGPRPPFHYSCRTTTAPVFSDDFKFLREGSRRPAKGVDSSGKTDIKQVRGSTRYYSWLKTQPAFFQNKILGPARGKLLRNGGLDADQFAVLNLNKNFQPLTLDEMAKIAPQAFKDANLLDSDGNVVKS